MSGGSDYHDFVQLPAEGQSTPTNYVTPGALTTVTSTLISTLVTAQISTQTNPGGPSYGINSIVQAEQALAVAGPTYNSPGGVLNKVGPGNTGGGP